MLATAARKPSFEELYQEITRLPQGMTGEILVPGELRTMSRPGRKHRRAAKLCDDFLRQFDRDRGGHGWWIEWEAEIRLPGDRLVVPDIAGWRIERVPHLPDENPLTVLPDWCCEVSSPSTARDDRILKLPLYAECAIEWTWLIHPDWKSVEVYRAVGGKPLLVHAVAADFAGALPPFEAPLSLSTLWLSEVTAD